MKKILPIISAIIVLQIFNLSLSAQSASITCPANKTVSTGAGTCPAIVNNIDPVVSPAGALVSYRIENGALLTTGGGSASGMSFLRGMNTVTYTLLDYPGVSCSFTIIVEDHEP